MNIAELIGELDSAVAEARVAGNRVQKAIENLKEIFGSLVGVQMISVTEPTIPLDENDPERIFCPYCDKTFPPWTRPHRDSPHYGRNFRLVRHISQERRYGRDHR